MSLREKINQNPIVAVALVVVVILVAGYVIYTQTGSDLASQGNAWFTTDDGATWFRGDIRNDTPPFPHDGKEAVMAYVYTCPDGKEFTALLERYQPAARALWIKAKADPNSLTQAEREEVGSFDMRREWKKPGEKEWRRAGNQMPEIKCDDGSVAKLLNAR